MKLSLNWMKDYVEIPVDVDLSRLSYDLTMSTVEVEGVHRIADGLQNILVGRIEEVLPHPNADKLRVCRVNLGDAVREIVCGGSNLAVGMNVIVAAPGAMVRWHGEGEPVEIKCSKLRGVESYGMICAASEVGLADLFPAREEAEIVDLSAFEIAPGTPVAEALDLDDIILEIDNKSMTNRPDLWGHYGMARELSAIYHWRMREIAPYTPPAGTPEMEIVLADSDRSPRYIGVEMNGVAVKPAPFAMQVRLWKVGLRPINALVDITNYVMMAVGQPTHAFDADQIHQPITVRPAKQEEALRLLNGKELTLSADDLVIADAKEAVALAGVMGGEKDSILPTTRRVILEVANFEATGIRRTALRYDNRTDASTRYEKGIDPDRCDQALALAMELFAKEYPELQVTKFGDHFPKPLQKNEIDVSMDWLSRRLGRRLDEATLKDQLCPLGYEVSFSGDTMHVLVPSWRSTGDVSIPADMMEEVARIYGYENFRATTITTSFEGGINQLQPGLVRSIEEYLAYRCGMQEIFTYPWMKDEFVHAILPTTEGILTLPTPPSPNEKYLRSSILPNLCEAVVKNERYYEEFSIFEEAQVFDGTAFTTPYDPEEKLPVQRKHLGLAFAKKTNGISEISELFRRVKGIFAEMARYTHMEPITFRKVNKPYYADNVAWLELYVGETAVGHLGLLAKKASLAVGIRQVSVILAELDLDALTPLRSRTNAFTHLKEYPVTEYDLSMLLDASVTWETVEATVRAKNRDLIQNVTFVEEYRGKQIPEGKKSLTLRLDIGAVDHTLTSAEIEACASSVIKRLSKELAAEIRGK